MALFRTAGSTDDGDTALRPLKVLFWRLKMDVPVTEEQIRTLAFYLWENEGSPEGRSQDYWEKARQQLGIDDSPAELDEEADLQAAG